MSFAFLRRLVRIRQQLRPFRHLLIFSQPWSRLFGEGQHFLAGHLAYSSVLALPAFLIFMLASGKLLGQQTAISSLVRVALTSMPPEMAALVQNSVDDMLARPAVGFFTGGLAASLWISSGLLDSLRQGLNRAYGAKVRTNYWLLRFQAVLITAILGALIIGLGVLLVYAPLAQRAVEESVGADLNWLIAGNSWRLSIASLLIFFVSWSAHCFLPLRRPPALWLLPGAFMSTLMWFVLIVLFTQNLRSFNRIGEIYGALTSGVLALLFFYLSALVFLYGAYLNAEIRQHRAQLLARFPGQRQAAHKATKT